MHASVERPSLSPMICVNIYIYMYGILITDGDSTIKSNPYASPPLTTVSSRPFLSDAALSSYAAISITSRPAQYYVPSFPTSRCTSTFYIPCIAVLLPGCTSVASAILPHSFASIWRRYI